MEENILEIKNLRIIGFPKVSRFINMVDTHYFYNCQYFDGDLLSPLSKIWRFLS